MTLFAIVALSLAGLAVYVAYKNPKLGAALLVGAGILGVIYLLGQHADDPQTPVQAPPPAVSSSAPAVAGGEAPRPSVSPSVQASQPPTEVQPLE
ncbi:hypothetical protein AB0M86_45135 [Streptomyces sp. NPDC051639]|uniref:hypothetical protein n=1 Tax=unclassified Streptomyces TaxID=2593676 RepID=UPI00341750DC